MPIPVHPYMLRRTGLYYRAALLLQTADLSLHECCLLWNYYATSSMSASAQLEYQAIERKKEEAFLLAFEQLKAFAGISADENVIDYLLGAYLLFPRLQAIPEGYWLAPADWRLKTLPKTFITTPARAKFF